MSAIERSERQLMNYLDERLCSLPSVSVPGSGEKVCYISLSVSGVKPQEVAKAPDEHHIVICE